MDWSEIARRGDERYRDGERRLAGISDADPRQRQLTRMANAAGGAALAWLMLLRTDEAASRFALAAERYRESWDDAPPDSWGRPLGAIKARILAADWHGAEEDARWALDAGAAGAESPIGRYAGCLAALVLRDDPEARRLANSIREGGEFPHAVGDALATIAAGDRLGYLVAVEDVLESFATRDEYLEDVPVADTVLVLQALARRRDVAVDLPASPLLPSS